MVPFKTKVSHEKYTYPILSIILVGWSVLLLRVISIPNKPGSAAFVKQCHKPPIWERYAYHLSKLVKLWMLFWHLFTSIAFISRNSSRRSKLVECFQDMTPTITNRQQGCFNGSSAYVLWRSPYLAQPRRSPVSPLPAQFTTRWNTWHLAGYIEQCPPATYTQKKQQRWTKSPFQSTRSKSASQSEYVLIIRNASSKNWVKSFACFAKDVVPSEDLLGRDRSELE